MRVKNQEFKKQIFDNNFLNLIQILFCFRILDNLTLIDFSGWCWYFAKKVIITRFFSFLSNLNKTIIFGTEGVYIII